MDCVNLCTEIGYLVLFWGLRSVFVHKAYGDILGDNEIVLLRDSYFLLIN